MFDMAVLLGWLALVGLVVVATAFGAQALEAAVNRSVELRRRRRRSRL
jgi:hypothetical protein